jgi:hypothetical protein
MLPFAKKAIAASRSVTFSPTVHPPDEDFSPFPTVANYYGAKVD